MDHPGQTWSRRKGGAGGAADIGAKVMIFTKRGKVSLILVFSMNTNCENMAYRSFWSEKHSAGRGVRKLPQGKLACQPSVHSDIAF